MFLCVYTYLPAYKSNSISSKVDDNNVADDDDDHDAQVLHHIAHQNFSLLLYIDDHAHSLLVLNHHRRFYSFIHPYYSSSKR